MASVDFNRLAVPRERAAAIMNARVSKVDYWTRTGVIGQVTESRVTPGRLRRLYGYTELMSLLVVQELRRRNVTLQHVRRIADRLRKLGYPQPLTEIGYAVVGAHVFLQLPDGTWLDDEQPGQSVMAETLNLKEFRLRVTRNIERSGDTEGHVEKRRGALGSKELIAGTRIPVATVRRYLEAGRSPQQIIESFPILTPADVAVAQSSPAA